MVLGIFLGAAAIFVTSIFYLRVLKHSGRRGTIVYVLLSNTIEFTGMVILASLPYLVAEAVVSLTPDSVSLERLLEFESALTKMSSGLRPFKLNPYQVLLVLLVLYLFATFGLAPSSSRRLRELLAIYRRSSRRLVAILVLLCSFTLFGRELGEPTDSVRARIATIRQGYADLRQDVSDAISEDVAAIVMEKVVDAFPTGYRNVLETVDKSYGQAEAFAKYYESVRSKLSVGSVSAGILVAKLAVRDSSRVFLPAVVPDPDRFVPNRAKASRRDTPLEVSELRVREARDQVASSRRPSRELLLQIFTTEDGKAIALHLPSCVSEFLKKELFASYIEQYPFLEPLVDAVVQTGNEASQLAIEDELDSASEEVLRAPESAQRSLMTAAVSVARRVHAAPTAKMTAAAQNAAAQIESEHRQIISLHAQIESTAHRDETQQTVRNLIIRLGSDDETVREAAVDQFVKLSEPLDADQIRNLAHIVEEGQLEWFKPTQPGSDQTRFERTSIKYYAGRALLGTRSSHVSAETKNEARRAVAKEKRTMTREQLVAEGMGGRAPEEIDKLIINLGSDDVATREAAVSDLVARGAQMSPKQVDHLAASLREGDVTWREKVGRESHCTIYKETSKRYYSGRVLSRISSPYVSSQLAKDAQKGEETGQTRRRVVDSGWI